MFVRRARSSHLLAVLLTVAACGDPERPETRSPATGTWVLQSIDGQPLPFAATAASGCRLTIDSSLVVIPAACTANRCGSWRDHVREGPPPAACAASTLLDSHEVIWALSASNLLTVDVLYPTERRSQVGQIEGDRLTFSIRDAVRLPDGEYVYRRRD